MKKSAPVAGSSGILCRLSILAEDIKYNRKCFKHNPGLIFLEKHPAW